MDSNSRIGSDIYLHRILHVIGMGECILYNLHSPMLSIDVAKKEKLPAIVYPKSKVKEINIIKGFYEMQKPITLK